MLNNFQSALYQRLQTYDLDDPTHEFGFTRHLMKNQGWTRVYTQRAIAEYKKFAFLTVTANHQVVPSDQVDQVWHAHVLLTQSYWDEFCPKILGQKLHHHPARGGRTERAEFHRLYEQTIASYRQFFGSPPIDIWSPPDVRFGAELKMQRISLSDHWVIPKRLLRLKFVQPLRLIAIAICVTLGMARMAYGSTWQSTMGSLFDKLWVILSLGLTVLGLILRYIIRSPSQQPQKPQLDLYEIAYLAGGSGSGGDKRAVELAITQLVHQGYLRLNVTNRTFAIAKQISPDLPDLEQQVMQQVQRTPEWASLRQAHRYNVSFLKASLEQKKLLMTGRAAFMGLSFILYILTFFCLVTLGTLFINIFDINISGLTPLTVPYYAMGIITFWCCVPSLRTRWGSCVLADIRKNQDNYDVIQRFALYGYEVLSGGKLDDLKQIFKAEAMEESSSCGCGC